MLKSNLILLITLVITLDARSIHRREKKSVFAGTGTFYDPSRQGGANGACGGSKVSSSSHIVALNSGQYGPMNKVSEWCGKKVLIKHAEKKTIATIQDACPGCQEKSLDMTPSVFNKLADSKQGVISITWCVVGDGDCN